MNIYLNLNYFDNWLELTIKKNEPNNQVENHFFYQTQKKLIADIFFEWLKNANNPKTIKTINLVVSLKDYKQLNNNHLKNFIELNKTWNIKLLEQIQPIINYCYQQKINFNFFYLVNDVNKDNLVNMAMVDLLKTLTISLNYDLKQFNILIKLVVLNKLEPFDLNKIYQKLNHKNLIVISNFKYVKQLKFNQIKNKK